MPTMTNIDICIDVRSDLELRGFLSERDVRWRPHAGVFNAPPPDPSQIAKMIEMLKDAPPYLIVTGGAAIVLFALAEYAKARRKRLVVERSLKRIKIDATNWTPEDFQKVDHLDIFKFEPEDKDDT